MFDIFNYIDNLNNQEAGDYFQDGLLMCGKCHTCKQMKLEIPTSRGIVTRIVPVLCECGEIENKIKDEGLAKEKQQKHVTELRERCIQDRMCRDFTFANHDGRYPEIFRTCQDYVAHWNQMKHGNKGILFYGPVGAGKTYMAFAIANALIDQEVPCYATNISNILNQMQGFETDKETTIEHLRNYRCMVIDDFGTERDTSFAVEQIYNIINTRATSGYPTIFTTNLTMHELENPTDGRFQKIFSRVYGMCPIKILVDGEDGRKKIAEKNRQEAREILSRNR